MCGVAVKAERPQAQPRTNGLEGGVVHVSFPASPEGRLPGGSRVGLGSGCCRVIVLVGVPGGFVLVG